MNLVFLGTPTFAKDILEGLHTKHTILGVITQTDKPFGRKKILKAPETKQYCIIHDIPCFQPIKAQEIPAILEQIESQHAIEAIIVVAYGKILPKTVTSTYLCLNLHGSILPYFRGASPVQHSIINDYLHFGLTVIAMDEGLDTGDILATKTIHKQQVQQKLLEEVFKTLVPHSIELLDSVLNSLKNNVITRQAQEHTQATYCTKLQKKDGILNLENAKACYLRYLALHDRGISLVCQYGMLKINEITGYEETPLESHFPKGTILEIDSKQNRFSLSCTRGKLWISAVTPENKPKMSALSFLQSKGLKVGDTLC
ncbi:methionyl-tRNA formyltransferase [Helicobacter aurati]|uniref:methionyl-tRNA formyltransferase n=1 Tax=Helicobacter aurati TaxID=137778 RepID=A0A3D8IZ34_9HELI|nr:methionyl-tRNA formyltransferase [Helicobacter aurati]RDU70528.1 methionyl-tRNA formyltransferase [Helicobacter aurati]